jgi:hypothetical protein
MPVQQTYHSGDTSLLCQRSFTDCCMLAVATAHAGAVDKTLQCKNRQSMIAKPTQQHLNFIEPLCSSKPKQRVATC